MTNEQAISAIETAKAECEWNAPLDYQIAFDMAIEALKKQILQKVKHQYMSHYGAITCFDEFLCPVCDYRFSDGDGTVEEYYDFCPCCGQALDWSEDNG